MIMESKKIIVTGSKGFLGSRIVDFYSSAYDVYAFSHTELDITNLEQLEEKFVAIQPDVVFHCAAISDTGYSQQHPDESEAINLWGTVNVARACKMCGAKLVFMSSDQVYNGNVEQGLLPESIEVHPVSVYGQHKLSAEKEVAKVLESAVGLRLTWMYDLPNSSFKLNRNLLVNLLHASQCNETIKAATREYRGITSVWEVVKRLDKCIDLPGGIYNFGCENTLNSFATFVEAAKCMNLPSPEQLIISDNERFPDHPRNLSMSLAKLRSYGIDFPSTCKGFSQALRTAIL